MRKMTYILLLTFLISQGYAQTLSDEEFKPMPESANAIGLEISYSYFHLSSKYNMTTFSSRFLDEDRNADYEVEGKGNYKISILYNYHLDNKRIFALGGKLSFNTRCAKLTAYPKYSVLDPESLDSANMLTKSEIKTYFDAISLDVSIYGRLHNDRDVYMYLGLGPNLKIIFYNKKSDYSSTIMGLVSDDGDIRKTDITYKNGSQKINFDNSQVPELGTSIEGNSFQAGLNVSLGIECFVRKDMAIRLEFTTQEDFTNYFKKKSSGLVTTIFVSLGVLHSGLF